MDCVLKLDNFLSDIAYAHMIVMIFENTNLVDIWGDKMTKFIILKDLL